MIGFTVAFGLLGGLLAGCGTSAIYIGTTTQEMFYKLPNGWKVYNEKTLEHDGVITGSGPLFESIATSDRSIDPSTVPAASHGPWAEAVVASLSSTAQQQVSFSSLNDIFVPVDQLNQQAQGSVSELAQPQLVVRGGLRGTRIEFQVPSQTGMMSFVQEALVNSPSDKIWALIVGCSSACFNANQSEINNIIDSWTVLDKGTS